jgi:hypothetical protein
LIKLLNNIDPNTDHCKTPDNTSEGGDRGPDRSRQITTAKAVPLHATKALGERGVQLLLILDLGTRWG